MNRNARPIICQALEYFFQAEDEENGEKTSSDGESEGSEEDTEPSFVSQPDAEQEDPQPSTRCTPRKERPPREEDPLFLPDSSDEQSDDEGPVTAQKRKRGSESLRRSMATRGQASHSRSSQLTKIEDWKTEREPDTAPPPLRFRPLRPHGIQVDTTLEHTPLNLFQLFFSPAVVRELCINTNKYAAQATADKSYSWQDVNVGEFYRFLGVVLFTSLIKLPCIEDYWKRDSIMCVSFPRTIMSRIRFQSLTWNLHISDPEKNQENDKKKGTPDYDKLFCVRPLMDDIRAACKACYHPRRELSVDERMVATKAKTGMTQYIKNKPTKWGIKLFVLADSSNGYTVDFSVYIGQSYTASVNGLAYDVVMNLVQPKFLGTGYHIYMDNFYTSPKLLTDLAALKFGACGTYREGRKGCPTSQGVITKQSPRGTMRWIRQGSIVFVKCMDTREVSVCSTVHPAFAGDTVKRKVKDKDGRYKKSDIPFPAPILEYNKYMGGVDRSDQLIQYYSVHRRSNRWYCTLFLHFLDIACTNAYIMHLELANIGKQQRLSHKDFLVELVKELCSVEEIETPVKKQLDHAPVACAQEFNSSNRATVGRRRCQNCSHKGVRNTTPWKCQSCDIPLCLLLDRNCFVEWHSAHK